MIRVAMRCPNFYPLGMSPYDFSEADPVVRARMSRIRKKGSRAEQELLNLLAEAGMVYTPHAKVEGVEVDALVEPRVCVFVDSPFWHWREDYAIPQVRQDYWEPKLRRNKERDREQNQRLRAAGYSVIRAWSDRLEGLMPRVRRAVARQHKKSG
jgi:DNA mismatch endonuclease, patch repair protein